MEFFGNLYQAFFGGPFFWIVLVLVLLAYLLMSAPSQKVDRTTIQPSLWIRDNYLLFVFAIGTLAIIGAVTFYLAEIAWSISLMVDLLRETVSNKASKIEDIKNIAYGKSVLMAALVAGATLIFTLIRTWINERTTRATEEGLITDRINKAVESLGAEKVVKLQGGEEETRPNIEVRVGAILALERLAQQNDSVHVQIMEILCSYLRANAPRREEETRDWMEVFRKNYKLPETPWQQRPDLHVFQYNMPNHELPTELAPPREDIQMTLHVIGRRGDDKIAVEKAQSYRIDLGNCCFDRADLKNAKLKEANLMRTQLQGANLLEAQMQGAKLSWARFDSSTKLTRALLCLVSVKSIDFTNISISDEQLEMTFGDGSVTIDPERRPMHWPKEKLEWIEFYGEHKKWAADPEAYVPPQDRKE